MLYGLSNGTNNNSLMIQISSLLKKKPFENIVLSPSKVGWNKKIQKKKRHYRS